MNPALLDAIRITAAVCCTVAPVLLLLANIPVRDQETGERQWVLGRADWFLRFSTYGFTWSIAYGFWEATIQDAPAAPRTWIVALTSVYLLIASVVLVIKRFRSGRPAQPPPLTGGKG